MRQGAGASPEASPGEGGGPKPVHQDNYYFGPKDHDEMVTAWVALDDATVENGCLFFGEGTHLGPVIPHTSPPGEPFNLLIPEDVAVRQERQQDGDRVVPTRARREPRPRAAAPARSSRPHPRARRRRRRPG